mmetsp:Transcript_14319/g.27224  ORF Transcript_14319/g.27224 Transcript_14319/m.27224 type:complete len:451 (+) Transcript_14319:67-1419(+)
MPSALLHCFALLFRHARRRGSSSPPQKNCAWGRKRKGGRRGRSHWESTSALQVLEFLGHVLQEVLVAAERALGLGVHLGVVIPAFLADLVAAPKGVYRLRNGSSGGADCCTPQALEMSRLEPRGFGDVGPEGVARVLLGIREEGFGIQVLGICDLFLELFQFRLLNQVFQGHCLWLEGVETDRTLVLAREQLELVLDHLEHGGDLVPVALRLARHTVHEPPRPVKVNHHVVRVVDAFQRLLHLTGAVPLKVLLGLSPERERLLADLLNGLEECLIERKLRLGFLIISRLSLEFSEDLRDLRLVHFLGSLSHSDVIVYCRVVILLVGKLPLKLLHEPQLLFCHFRVRCFAPDSLGLFLCLLHLRIPRTPSFVRLLREQLQLVALPGVAREALGNRSPSLHLLAELWGDFGLLDVVYAADPSVVLALFVGLICAELGFLSTHGCYCWCAHSA